MADTRCQGAANTVCDRIVGHVTRTGLAAASGDPKAVFDDVSPRFLGLNTPPAAVVACGAVASARTQQLISKRIVVHILCCLGGTRFISPLRALHSLSNTNPPAAWSYEVEAWDEGMTRGLLRASVHRDWRPSEATRTQNTRCRALWMDGAARTRHGPPL